MTRITVSMPDALARSLQAEARLRRLSVSEIVRRRLEESEQPYPGLGFIAIGEGKPGTQEKSAEELLDEWAREALREE